MPQPALRQSSPEAHDLIGLIDSLFVGREQIWGIGRSSRMTWSPSSVAGNDFATHPISAVSFPVAELPVSCRYLARAIDIFHGK